MIDDRDRTRLQELDAALAAVPLPTGLHARIAASAETRASRRHLALALVLSTAAVVLAFVVGRSMAPTTVAEPTIVAQRTTPPAADTVETAPPLVATYWGGRLQPDEACAIEGDVELAVRGDCRLRLAEPSLSIDVWGGARLVSVADGVRVQDGVALFHVDRIAADARRVRVEVSAGAIEVIGTRFVVVQTRSGGHVDLLEGAIAFVDRDGIEHAVVPGQRLGWEQTQVRTIAPITTHVTSPTRSDVRPPKPASAPLDVDGALERVAAHRRAGRYDDAIAELVRLRRSVEDPSVAEVLSYEEGTLRMHADRPAEICAFWRGHLARFGSGDHAASIREHMATAHCTEP
jgi:hypothetical protein